MTTNKSDVVSSIHCSYEQASPNQHGLSIARNQKSRRVRFPDELITSYLEPFRPVSDNCTSEELVAAYLQSCYQHKAQPIEFLLEQLKGIDLSICNDRYSILSLRGIRLSRLQVETLEEVFRRVHFRELDFGDTYLDDASASALFDMLLHYETCNELTVTLNLNTAEANQAWSRCVFYLRRASKLRRFALTHTSLSVEHFLTVNFFGLCLDRLSLRHCNLSGQALFGLVRWLKILLSANGLDPPERDRSQMTNGGSGGRAARRSALLRRIGRHRNFDASPKQQIGGSEQPPVWEFNLDLANNRLNSNDVETLLLLVRHRILVPQLPSDSTASQCSQPSPVPVGGIGFLSSLDLSNNNIGDHGLRTLSCGMVEFYRTRLRKLNPETEITKGREVNELTTDTSSLHSNEPISLLQPDRNPCPMQVRGLERLILTNNNLTANGMHSLALWLMHTPVNLIPLIGGLVCLDLNYNPDIRDDGVEILCDGLIRNHSLKELHLRGVRMSFPGIFALSSYLSESKYLQLLDIRSNKLNLASLMALSKTLVLNYTLTSLLSDSHSLTTSSNPLDASDVELIHVLIEEIDTCLRRNRSIPTKNSLHPFIKSFTTEDPPNLEIPVASPHSHLIVDPSITSTRPKDSEVLQSSCMELDILVNESSCSVLNPDSGVSLLKDDENLSCLRSYNQSGVLHTAPNEHEHITECESPVGLESSDFNLLSDIVSSKCTVVESKCTDTTTNAQHVPLNIAQLLSPSSGSLAHESAPIPQIHANEYSSPTSDDHGQLDEHHSSDLFDSLTDFEISSTKQGIFHQEDPASFAEKCLSDHIPDSTIAHNPPVADQIYAIESTTPDECEYPSTFPLSVEVSSSTPSGLCADDDLQVTNSPSVVTSSQPTQKRNKKKKQRCKSKSAIDNGNPVSSDRLSMQSA